MTFRSESPGLHNLDLIVTGSVDDCCSALGRVMQSMKCAFGLGRKSQEDENGR